MVSFLLTLLRAASAQNSPLELQNTKDLSIDELILAHPVSTTIISLIFVAVLLAIILKAYISWNAANEVKVILQSKYMGSKEAKSLMNSEISNPPEFEEKMHHLKNDE